MGMEKVMVKVQVQELEKVQELVLEQVKEKVRKNKMESGLYTCCDLLPQGHCKQSARKPVNNHSQEPSRV